MFVVHYHKTTGEINLWGSDDGAEESILGSDYALAHFEEWQNINPKTQCIHVGTQQIISKPREVKLEALALDIKAAISNELLSTDQYMVSDRPISDEAREEWRVYRQELRDLKGRAEELLAAWPKNPKGIDSASMLKVQLVSILEGK